MFWSRVCISHGGEEHGVVHISWGKKHILCGIFHVRNVVETWLLNQKIVVLDRHKKLKGGDWRCKMSAMK